MRHGEGATPRQKAPAGTAGPSKAGITPVLERNIQALCRRRQREQAVASRQERLAQAITDFAGTMWFVYLHALAVGFWTVANLGWIPGITPWDPSFVVLAMVASVEAIFLSTFVLIAQNRLADLDEKRAELDLQISLLAEHEITKLVQLVSAIAQHLGLEAELDQEVKEIEQDVAPEAVLDELEANR